MEAKWIVARNLRRWMDERKLTQEQMAKVIGTTQPQLCNAMRSPSKFYLDTVDHWAKCMGMTISEFLKE